MILFSKIVVIAHENAPSSSTKNPGFVYVAGHIALQRYNESFIRLSQDLLSFIGT